MANNVFERSVAPLLADATYVGQWQDMTGYQSVAVMITGDQIVAEARLEWSDDRDRVRFIQPWFAGESPVSYGGGMASANSVLCQFVRLVVVNGSTDQGLDWSAQVALLQSPPAGQVAPLVDFPDDSDLGQTVRAVLYGRREGLVDPQYTQVVVDGTGALLPGVNPLPSTNFGQRIAATLDSTLVTSVSPEDRRSLSIFNSSTAGNLYVRLGGDVDISFDEWDCKVLPGWMWVSPEWGGDVYIAWDNDADGFGHCQEVTG